MTRWQSLLALAAPVLYGRDEAWTSRFLTRFKDSPPSLEQLWGCMDEVWDDCFKTGITRASSLSRFYSHPIWQINGLFIEQDDLSLKHRQQFALCSFEVGASRIADYGGGFGTLGRLIGALNPDCNVHIVDPFPSPIGQQMSRNQHNVLHSTNLEGFYDVIFVIDVLEHLDEPISAILDLANHVDIGGRILLANCFYPVIKCHLPSTFYLQDSLGSIMSCLGFHKEKTVCYGDLFKRRDRGSQASARCVSAAANLLYTAFTRVSPALRDTAMKVLFATSKV